MTEEIEVNETPRIVVDDDWKAQVQREKEQAKHETNTGSKHIPDASFGLLITTLTTQALASLGIIPNPVTGLAETNREMAKHFIDTLGVLEQKTAGNLTSNESHLLSESLHQLRMAYVTGADLSLADADSDDDVTLETP
jgi:hypothetical protein